MITTPPAFPAEFWVDADGVRLHIFDWGGAEGGEPVILLHGVGGTGMFCNMLAPRLVSSLGETHRFVSLDQRGGGDSDKPESGYEIEHFGRDVLAVQDALGGAPATLVGHSRGGWVAAFVAGSWPERVARLVLIDPARLAYESMSAADAFYARVRAGLGPFAGPDTAVSAAKAAQPDAYWGPERQAAVLDAQYVAADGSVFGKMPGRVLTELQRVRLQADLVRPMMDNITASSLLFVSSRSAVDRQAQKLEYAELIAGTEVMMLDGTHNLAHDCVDDVTAAITRLCSSDDGASTR
jgi:pimeloyl-ACP methyl ester carboxylesterase